MATVVLDERSKARYLARLGALTPASQRKWGAMTPDELLAHLTRGFEISLGEFPVKDESTPGVRWAMKILFFYVLPWPKGRIKAPEYFLPKPAAEFEAERAKLFAALERFVAAAAKAPERLVLNPVMGPISYTDWQRLHGMHMDHHLRQFGV